MRCVLLANTNTVHVVQKTMYAKTALQGTTKHNPLQNQYCRAKVAVLGNTKTNWVKRRAKPAQLASGKTNWVNPYATTAVLEFTKTKPVNSSAKVAVLGNTPP